MESARDTIILRNGAGVPCVGFGTWKMPTGNVGEEAVHQALADGFRHIDTAAAYGNESTVGRALASSGLHRNEFFVASKVWNDDRGFDATLAAFDRTLTNLRLDYLDLYLIHWPAARGDKAACDEVNLDTWRALESLYLDGAVRAIGVCNFKAAHLQPLMDEAEILPMVDQIEMHPGCNQLDTREFCRRNDIIVEAWSPLASGRILENETLLDIAARCGCSVAQLCLRWCLQSHAIPLPKSVHPDRIAEDARVFWFEIPQEDMDRIDALDPLGQSGLDPDTIDF